MPFGSHPSMAQSVIVADAENVRAIISRTSRAAEGFYGAIASEVL